MACASLQLDLVGESEHAAPSSVGVQRDATALADIWRDIEAFVAESGEADGEADGDMRAQRIEWAFYATQVLRPAVDQLEQLSAKALARINTLEGSLQEEPKEDRTSTESYSTAYDNGTISFAHRAVQGRLRLRDFAVVNAQLKFNLTRLRGGPFVTYIGNQTTEFYLRQPTDAMCILARVPPKLALLRSALHAGEASGWRDLSSALRDVTQLASEILGLIGKALEVLRRSDACFDDPSLVPVLDPPAPPELIVSIQIVQAALVFTATVVTQATRGSAPGAAALPALQPCVAVGKTITLRGLQAEVVEIVKIVCTVPPLEDFVHVLTKMFQVVSLMHHNTSAHLLVATAEPR